MLNSDTVNGTPAARWNSFPAGTRPLLAIQLCATLSFSVLYSSLVLYMTGELGLPAALANSMTGVFVALNFALHLLTGYLGGRYCSYRALFMLGMVAQTSGCWLLAGHDPAYLYLALGAFLIGSGINSTCINCMLTQCFAPDDKRRETAFIYNYAGMNLGFFIGFSLSGFFQLTHQYPRLFMLSSLGNIFALLFCFYHRRVLADKTTRFAARNPLSQKRWMTLIFVLIACMPWVLSQLLQFADLSNKIILVIGACMLLVAIHMGRKCSTRHEQLKMQAFIVLMAVAAIFWMLFQIGPMGLVQFIAHNVDRHSVLGTIPPQWFHNTNTICIVFGGPLLSWAMTRLRARGINVNTPAQFSIALCLIGLAFVLLPWGIARADEFGMVSPEFVIACFALQAMGELLISPIGYAMVGALVPELLQGVMMGMWMLMSGIGATLASYCSNWMTHGVSSVDPLLTNAGYSFVFLRLGLLAIATGLLLMVAVPKINRWIQFNQSLDEDLAEDSLTPVTE